MNTSIATLEANYKNLESNLVEIKLLLRENTKISGDTLIQAKETNGKVKNLLEWREHEANPLLSDYREKRAEARGAVRLWVLLGGGMFSIICYAFVSYMNSVKTEIINETVRQASPLVSDAVYNRLEKEYFVQVK